MHKSKTTLISLAAGIACLAAAPAFEAAAQVRGGGRTSVSRGGGGGHQAAARAPSANRSGQTANRSGQGASRSGQNVDRSNANRNVDRNSNRTVNNRSGNNINIDNDTNINIDGGNNGDWDWDDRDHHPVAAGVAFGAAAAVTSAVVGSMIYSLPPACSPYMGSYYSCGGVYYAPQYPGDTVVYVVVDQPGGRPRRPRRPIAERNFRCPPKSRQTAVTGR